jgi:hypothetical protein
LRDLVGALRRDESGDATRATSIGVGNRGAKEVELLPVGRDGARGEPGFGYKEGVAMEDMREGIVNGGGAETISIPEAKRKKGWRSGRRVGVGICEMIDTYRGVGV